MTHEEIVLEKKERVLRGIKLDIVSMTNSNDVPDSFSLHMYTNHKNATPGGKSKEVYDYTVGMVRKHPIYRLKINKSASIDTDCYDLIDSFAPELKRHYASVDDLPEWVKEKLAVLMVIDPNQLGGREIEDVGRRISQNIFWIYADGNDPRKSGQDES
jgi:hypothetical protein